MRKKREKETERAGGRLALSRQRQLVCARLQIFTAPLRFWLHNAEISLYLGAKAGQINLPCKTAKTSPAQQQLLPDNMP
jgi:hypothetical protein